MRRWDQSAVSASGIPERVLIEAAGRAAAAEVERWFPRGKVVVVAGKGNNGRDALVVARALAAWGREVIAVSWPDAMDRTQLHGWPVDLLTPETAERALSDAAVVVDGVLGTGSRGAPRGAAAELIRWINRAERPVLALDVPSGVDPTTGEATGDAVAAAVTVTFGAIKRGLLRFPGRERAGHIVGVEVGFPPLDLDVKDGTLVTPAWAEARLPPVPADAHKGALGTVSVIAGRAGSAGAAVMVGTAALSAGAGMVRMFSVAENRDILQTGLPEALFHDRDSSSLPEVLASSAAVVAGPGFGTGDRERDLLRTVIGSGTAPLLLDADALTLLADDPELLANTDRSVLLTPHPGEMGRLLGVATGAVVQDPFAAAARAVERWNCVVLLKGAPSLVASPTEPALVSVTGHAGIATGGMGDTLAGIAGALLAIGAPPAEAGALALFYAGRAAEIAGRGRGLLPRHVADALPSALLRRPDAESRLPPGVFVELPRPI